MENKDLITIIFFCFMLSMIVLFGCYKIGECCILCEKNCSKSINIVYVSEEKISRLPNEIDDYTIISKKTDKVKKNKKNVIVLNNVILHKKMFKDINNVEKIYIFGDKVIADSDFFEDTKDKIVCIIGDNDYILKIKQIKSKGN